MEKILMFKADRNLDDELDLRKKPLTNNKGYHFYKVVDGTPVAYLDLPSYYLKDVDRVINRLNEGNFSIEIKQGITRLSEYYTFRIDDIEKTWRKYNKLFDGIDITYLDYDDILKQIEKIKAQRDDINDQATDLIKSCREIDHLTKKGRIRKINCKNKLFIDDKGSISISDDRTYIIARRERRYGEIQKFRLLKDPITFYSIDHMVISGDSFSRDQGEVYNLGKKKRQHLIELYSQEQKIRDRIIEIGVEFIESIN